MNALSAARYFFINSDNKDISSEHPIRSQATASIIDGNAHSA